jgi:hypothetical protein
VQRNRPDPAWLHGFSAAAVLESGPGHADISSMRLPLWEFTVAVLAILVGLLYLFAGDYYGAAMVFGFTVFLVAVRVRLDDQPETRGGERALRRYRVEMTQVAGLAVLILSTLATMIIAAAQSWQKDTRGSVALFALLGMEVLLLLDAQRRADSALAWLKGGRAETRVGDELDALRQHGWLVIHHLTKDRGGDVDHIVCGPRGAYAIETKSGHFAGRNAGQAEANSRFVKHKLGIKNVVPIVCVGNTARPMKKGQVWVMSSEYLVPWLLSRRDRPVDAEMAGALLLAQR